MRVSHCSCRYWLSAALLPLAAALRQLARFLLSHSRCSSTRSCCTWGSILRHADLMDWSALLLASRAASSSLLFTLFGFSTGGVSFSGCGLAGADALLSRASVLGAGTALRKSSGLGGSGMLSIGGTACGAGMEASSALGWSFCLSSLRASARLTFLPFMLSVSFTP